MSSAEGKFERGRLPPGMVGIEVSAAGYAPWRAFTTLAGGARREVDATLYPARRVEGVVRAAATGAPIAEAGVFLFSSPSTEPDSASPGAEEVDDRVFRTGMAMTNAAGRFVVRDARDGELRHPRPAHRVLRPAGEDPSRRDQWNGAEFEPMDLPGSTIQVAVEGLDSLTAPDIFFAVEVAPATPGDRWRRRLGGAGGPPARSAPD